VQRLFGAFTLKRPGAWQAAQFLEYRLAIQGSACKTPVAKKTIEKDMATKKGL